MQQDIAGLQARVKHMKASLMDEEEDHAAFRLSQHAAFTLSQDVLALSQDALAKSKEEVKALTSSTITLAAVSAAIQQHLLKDIADQQARTQEVEKQLELLQSLSVRCTEDGRKVQDWVRLTYMKLLETGVSANMCATVVRTVLDELPGSPIVTDKDLPAASIVNRCRHELGALCKIDMAVKIATQCDKAAVLATDEGSHNQESSNALVVHYDDMKSQCLGVQKMATHFAREGADKIEQRMDEFAVLSQRISKDLGSIQMSEAQRSLSYSVGGFSGTMSDQCASQKATNKLLQRSRLQKSQNGTRLPP